MYQKIFICKLLALIFVLAITSGVFCQDFDPENPNVNTFAATVVDAKNQKTLIYDITYGKGLEKLKEFTGFRGASAVIIPFEKVKSIEVLGKTPGISDLYAGNPYVNTIFHLADGHTITVELPAEWIWRGVTAFGEMSIETQNLKVITFHHEGDSLWCPKCQTIFHLEGFNFCPYDGEELEVFIETP